MGAPRNRKPANNVVDIAWFRKRRLARVISESTARDVTASVFGRITARDNVEYGMVEVDQVSAPRLMRALLKLMDELMDVASL